MLDEKDELDELPDPVGGPVFFNFVDDLPSRAPDDNAEWSIQTDWDGQSPYTTFSLSFEAGLGGNEPIPGWASWIDGDLLVAHVDYNGPGQEAVRISRGSPFGDNGEGAPAAWLQLARTLVRVVMREAPESHA